MEVLVWQGFWPEISMISNEKKWQKKPEKTGYLCRNF